MRNGVRVVGRVGRGVVLVAACVAALAGCGRDGAQASPDGAGDGGAADRDASRGTSQRNEPQAAKVAAGAGAPRGRVLFVGTSLTAGLGLEPEEAYPAVIAGKIDSAGLPFEVVNAGMSGETSSGALRRIDWLLREPAEVVVIETGANDGLRGVPVAALRENLRAIVARVRALRPEARVLLVQMEALPNFGPEYTGTFRTVYPEIAREHGVTLVPFLLDGVAGVARLNQPDGIHPTAEGARLVAANIWETLAPVLEAEAASLDAAAAGQ